MADTAILSLNLYGLIWFLPRQENENIPDSDRKIGRIHGYNLENPRKKPILWLFSPSFSIYFPIISPLYL